MGSRPVSVAPQVGVAGRHDAEVTVQDEIEPWRRLEEAAEVGRVGHGRSRAHLLVTPCPQPRM